MVRVLWITANFHPEVGGMQAYTAQLTKLLADTNHVGLVTASGHWVPQPSRVAHTPCPRLGGARWRWIWQRTRENLRRIVADFEPDVVHWANAGIAVYHDVMPAGACLVATVHATDLTQPWQLAPGRDVRQEIHEGLARCHEVIAVSRHTASLVTTAGLAAPRVILNGCDLQVFRRQPIDREALLRRLDIPTGVLLLLTVARLAERKGHRVIAEALAGLDRPFHWVVVGDGEYRRQVRRAVIERGLGARTSFFRRLRLRELVALYNSCDIFVLAPTEIHRRQTSDSEGFGIVFSEASACAKPVVASDVSGCREAVLDGVTGLLVPPGEPTELCRAITRLADRPALREQLGSCGLEHVRAQGGWERVAQEVQEVYRDVLTPAARPRR